jgi:hypothetical protein
MGSPGLSMAVQILCMVATTKSGFELRHLNNDKN